MASSTTLGVKLSADSKKQLHQDAPSLDRTPHWVIKQLIGAVVGMQPFGGEGLPGTGPNAGGPLYLSRLVYVSSGKGHGNFGGIVEGQKKQPVASFSLLSDWSRKEDMGELTKASRRFAALSLSYISLVLLGPTGERNTYLVLPRERILCLADNSEDFFIEIAAVLSVGAEVVLQADGTAQNRLEELPGGQY